MRFPANAGDCIGIFPNAGSCVLPGSVRVFIMGCNVQPLPEKGLSQNAPRNKQKEDESSSQRPLFVSEEFAENVVLQLL